MASLGNNIVIKCDMLVSSTDVPPGMSSWQIARKSIVSCASDLAAKGAKPTAAMISLGVPRNITRPYVEGLAHGFAGASREFGVRIVGGDTNESSELIIDCCMVGAAGRRMPTRSGAQPGDVVVVSGMFGLPPAGLAILIRNAKSAGAFRKLAVQSVMEPVPRQQFGMTLGKFFSSSIDSSDGLAISLYELAASSGVDIVVQSIPSARGLEEFAKENNLDMQELIFHGGEEFQIVATIPKTDLGRAKAEATKSEIELNVIGRAKRGTGKVFVKDKPLENRGYVHLT